MEKVITSGQISFRETHIGAKEIDEDNLYILTDEEVEIIKSISSTNIAVEQIDNYLENKGFEFANYITEDTIVEDLKLMENQRDVLSILRGKLEILQNGDADTEEILKITDRIIEIYKLSNIYQTEERLIDFEYEQGQEVHYSYSTGCKGDGRIRGLVYRDGRKYYKLNGYEIPEEQIIEVIKPA